MKQSPRLARERIVALWLCRPPEARMMKHTEPFITLLERDQPGLLSQLRTPNAYQTVMALIRFLTTE